MTELAIRTENPVTTLPAERPAHLVHGAELQHSPLARWVEEAARAEQLATRLASTSFVPATLRGKPVEVMAAILAGIELGFQPMAALRSMDVIQGTPALRAHAMRGLVQSHGHDVELVGEPTSELVVMRGRRKGAQAWQQVKWDIPRAAKLGLLGKAEYKRQPMTMLIARATGEICRLVASDVIYAMPYAAEELDGDTLPDGRAFAEPRVTVDEVMNQGSAAEEPRPDYMATARAATSIEQWREVWGEAVSAGHLDVELKQQLVRRGQEIKDADHAPTAPAPDPGTTCGWCEQPGHFEDDCPQREDSDYDTSDGA
jgi:hypothetical protein